MTRAGNSAPVTLHGVTVNLTASERAIVREMATRPATPVAIAARLGMTPNLVRVMVFAIRRKLKAVQPNAGSIIRSEYGLGYTLVPPCGRIGDGAASVSAAPERCV